jgi:hypothetical protein
MTEEEYNESWRERKRMFDNALEKANAFLKESTMTDAQTQQTPELNVVPQLERRILFVRERLLNTCCLLGIDAELSEAPPQRDQGASAHPPEEMAARVRCRVHRLHVLLNECVSLQDSIIKSLEELSKLLEAQGLLR